MEVIVAYIFFNTIAIAIFYLLFGREAKKYKQRLKAAMIMLEKSHLYPEYVVVLKKSKIQGQIYFWIAYGVIVSVLYVGFSVYARSVEPNADLHAWFVLSILFYGIAIIGCSIIASIVATRLYQIIRVKQLLSTQNSHELGQQRINEVKGVIEIRKGETTVLTLTSCAMVGSLIIGVGYLVILYSAAQTAIACARSSKCM